VRLCLEETPYSGLPRLILPSTDGALALHQAPSSAALADPSIRMRLRLEKVNQIARHFVFLSRGHFARAYQEIYGYAPAATLAASL